MSATKFGTTGQFVAIAPEASYGAAAAAFNRVLPAIDDSWTPEVQEVGTDSFRPGRQAMVADQTVQIDVGGSGAVTCLLPNSGGFLMLRDLLDTLPTSVTRVTDATSLRKMTIKSDGIGPQSSQQRGLSILVGRVDRGQVRRETIYAGCVITGWTLSGSLGEPLNLAIEYDYAARSVRTPSSEASYSAPALAKKIAGPYYTWRDLQISIDGTEIPVATGLTVTADRALDTELYSLTADVLKDIPVRSGVPSYHVSLECRLDTITAGLRENWGTDGQTGSIVITLTGREDKKSSGSTPIYTAFVATFADAKVIGDEPVMSLDGMSVITVNMDVKDLYDGTSSTAQIEVVGAQTAID